MATASSLQLDRMAIEEVGLNPEKLADAIHKQLGLLNGPVPVREVALALDILEIREEALMNLEGVLLTTPQRGNGSILVNLRSPEERRRFSIGHELGHFLISSHRPISEEGFRCSSRDMAGVSEAAIVHRRQEAEANAFAINLLAPPHLLKKYLGRAPDMQHVLAMADDLTLSKEAAARRYVERHSEDLAAVFGKNGRITYWSAPTRFPPLAIQRGDQLPAEAMNGLDGRLTAMEAVDAVEWLRKPAGVALAAQTLAQQNAHSITLLHAEAADDSGDEDDTYSRFSKR